jgi:DNA polymerase (family X)
VSSGGKGASAKISMSLKEAARAAARVSDVLTKSGIWTATCGSLRRGKTAGIGDIDMVVARPVAAAVELVEKWAGKHRLPFEMVLNLKRDSKLAVFTVEEVPFNLYGASGTEWGAMVLFLTGNQLFNILMRGEAKKQGYKLNQYGLWLGEDQIAGKSEEQIFDALGLEYVKPEDRSVDYMSKKTFRPIVRKFG